MDISPYSLNSTVSSLESHDETIKEKLKNYVRNVLKNRIFLGRYMERRLVNEKIGYRDVILISNAEVELIKDLLDVQQKLCAIYKSSYWIGISGSESLEYNPPGLCIWTEIDNEPFGPFWFQIKSIKFRDNEVVLLLKCLRHITDAFIELEPILTGELKKSKNVTISKAESTTESSATIELNTNNIISCLKTALTISNVKEFVTFIFAFIFAIFAGSTSFVNFLGTFILGLIRETSNFVKSSTPAFLGFLDLIGKIIGGFYILLAMMFKPKAPSPFNQRRIAYKTPKQYTTYSDRSFD